MLRAAAAGLLSLLLLSAPLAQAPLPDALDKIAARWVDETFKKLTIDDKVGQLVVSSISSTYLSSDTDAFETLTRKGVFRALCVLGIVFAMVAYAYITQRGLQFLTSRVGHGHYSSRIMLGSAYVIAVFCVISGLLVIRGLA